MVAMMPWHSSNHGMKTPAQVRENLGALGWRISGAESDELERAARLAKTATQNIFQTD